MRGIWACLVGLASVALTDALRLEKRDSPAVLTVPMIRDISLPNSKRSSFDVNLANEQVSVSVALRSEIPCRLTSLFQYTSYVSNMTFGTPPQHFLAYFTTLGNGCWLKSVDNTSCGLYQDRSLCGGYGGYNLTASTTAQKLEEFAYDDSGQMTNGDFVTDVLKITH